MALEEFIPAMNPDWGLTSTPRADIYEGKLGDGYVVRRPNGINWLRESWNPTWSSLGQYDAEDMYDWLKVRLNLTPFLWEHPTTGELHRVVCTKVTKADSTVGIFQVSATFEQDFNLA